jgi:hypothetical protein
MAWFFEGTGTQLGLSISATGNLNVYGTCSQGCQPVGGDLDIFHYVDGIEGSWSLHSSHAAEREYDGAGSGLKDFFEQNQGRAAGLISYYGQDKQDPATVGASILMSRPMFEDTVSLFKLAMGNPKIKYVITLDFYGMSAAASTSEIPSLAEFVNPDLKLRRADISNEVTVSVLAETLAEGRR